MPLPGCPLKNTITINFLKELIVMPQLQNKRKCLLYTALGDSIAAGVGAANDYGYVDYFRDFLATRHQCANLLNRANSGFTSRDLLNQLWNDQITREGVKNADILTISIGGANLLHCLNSASPNNCLTNEIAAFTHDWPIILMEIRKNIRSDANLYVITVYNPLTGSDPNYDKVELFIQKINHIIKNTIYRSKFHYNVVDVHANFQGQFPNRVWEVCKWTHFCEFPPNPHPTDSGHKEIARLHELAYLHHLQS